MTSGGIMGFVICLAVGFIFIGSGVSCFKAKEATGFWANAKTAPIGDVKSYNRAMGKFWCVYGLVFIVFGIPLLLGNGAWIMASCVGMMLEAIGAMVIYTLKIEGKYRKK